jgi:amidophosphoribosyltransferase
MFQVHVRVASPPIKHPCYMGINIPTKHELVANRVDMDKIANHFGMYIINPATRLSGL